MNINTNTAAASRPRSAWQGSTLAEAGRTGTSAPAVAMYAAPVTVAPTAALRTSHNWVSMTARSTVSPTTPQITRDHDVQFAAMANGAKLGRPPRGVPR